MVDPGLWALMQRVETLRYRAERLERAAAALASPWRHVALGRARRLRRAAERMSAGALAGRRKKAA